MGASVSRLGLQLQSQVANGESDLDVATRKEGRQRNVIGGPHNNIIR